MHFGSYKKSELDFYEWYQYAVAEYEKSNYFTSVVGCMTAESLLKPIPYIVFDEEETVRLFIDKVKKEHFHKYTLPMQISELKTKPTLFNFTPIYTIEGIFPLFKYKTNQAFNSDSKKILETEANEIASVIIKKFPGVEKDKKMILFEVYEEIPTSNSFNQNVYKTKVTF